MKCRDLCFILLTMLSFSCGSNRKLSLETVENVDLEKYSGRWYEIARYPFRFEKGCRCVTAEYGLSPKGHVTVINRCLRANGTWTSIRGKAFIVKNSGNARLRVQFFWPFRGNYWIIDLADDYSYAVVSAPGRKYLWILSRTKTVSPDVYDSIMEKLSAKGFDLIKLEKTDQICEKSENR
jgi:apolipoprotein D and lipocalin family protein